MISTSWMFADTDRSRTKQEILIDYRARLAIEEETRAQQRQHDLAEQRSDANPPETRIGTWEKLHGLRMPPDPEHPILEIIALDTRLELCDVHAVQAARKRPAAKATVPVSGAPDTDVPTTCPERR